MENNLMTQEELKEMIDKAHEIVQDPPQWWIDQINFWNSIEIK
jgi:hypothetical protein